MLNNQATPVLNFESKGKAADLNLKDKTAIENGSNSNNNPDQFEMERWRLAQHQVQVIKEIGLSLTRQSPTEWNEFMIVALGD